MGIRFKSAVIIKSDRTWLGLWCWVPLSTLFQIYWRRKPKFLEKTINLSQVTDKLYHLSDTISSGGYYLIFLNDTKQKQTNFLKNHAMIIEVESWLHWFHSFREDGFSGGEVRVMVFNDTFNNISVISWQSV
jgi:hypothetical protein